MLKYSINKIENVDDYNKKMCYLNDFKESGVIDQEAFDELEEFLKRKLKKLVIKT
jgi:hypothetical protein